MVALRTTGVLLALLGSACFSPTGSNTSPDAGPTTDAASTSTTGAGMTSTSGPEFTDTGASATTAVGPTTSTTDPTTSTTDATAAASSTTLAPEVCGDGTHVDGEECDDGNDIDDDECTNHCTLPACGDSILHPVEECDEPGPNCVLCKRVWMQVFVTNEPQSVDFGGLDGADKACQLAADAAQLQGRFKAWLSTADVSAEQRLVHSAREYRLVNGEAVSSGWPKLVGGALQRPINVDEHGVALTDQTGCGVCPVWTATKLDGTAYPDSCSGWGMPGMTSARVGECSQADMAWTDGCGPLKCDMTARLYCLEQGLEP